MGSYFIVVSCLSSVGETFAKKYYYTSIGQHLGELKAKINTLFDMSKFHWSQILCTGTSFTSEYMPKCSVFGNAVVNCSNFEAVLFDKHQLTLRKPLERVIRSLAQYARKI